MPQLVPKRNLIRANGRLVSSLVVTDEFAGLAAGAALFTVGVLLPFGVHASLVLVAKAYPDLAAPRSRRSCPRRLQGVPSALASVRWLWACFSALRGMLILAVALVAADSAWFGLVLVLYTTQVLQLPAAVYGILVAVGAAGGLLELSTDWATRRLGQGRVFVGSVVLAADADRPRSDGVRGLAVVWSLSSAAFAAYNVVSTSVRQLLVPGALLSGSRCTAPARCRQQHSALLAAASSRQRSASGHRFSSGGQARFVRARGGDPPHSDGDIPRLISRHTERTRRIRCLELSILGIGEQGWPRGVVR